MDEDEPCCSKSITDSGTSTGTRSFLLFICIFSDKPPYLSEALTNGVDFILDEASTSSAPATLSNGTCCKSKTSLEKRLLLRDAKNRDLRERKRSFGSRCLDVGYCIGFQ